MVEEIKAIEDNHT
jgi:hypothetical protein